MSPNSPDFQEKIKTFLTKMDNHSSWNALSPEAQLIFASEGSALFPSSRFSGKAFRVISSTSVPGLDERFDITLASQPGSSWSHSIRGCESFLADIVISEGFDVFDGIIIEAEIVGFSIYNWLKEYSLMAKEFELPEVPTWVRQSEEEIILTELGRVMSTKRFDFNARRENNLKTLNSRVCTKSRVK
jgi:hypothetical protein